MKGLFSNADNPEDNNMVQNVVVELGPHPALQSASKQIFDQTATGSTSKGSIEQVTYLPSLVRTQ